MVFHIENADIGVSTGNAPKMLPDTGPLQIFRDRELVPYAVQEVRELQTALGLVAAGSGIALVPGSVERLRRDNVVYRPLDAPEAISPVIMSTHKGDRSPDVDRMLKIIKDMYKKDGITFGK